MMSNVVQKLKTTDKQAAVVSHLPSYQEIRSQLSRHRASRCTPVPDPLNIPEVLRVILRGRSVEDDDVNKNEPFLMYTGQGGRLLVFCAKTELKYIHES